MRESEVLDFHQKNGENMKKAKGTYLFPRKNKDELIENPFEILGEPSDDFGELWSSALSLANGSKESLSGGSPQQI